MHELSLCAGILDVVTAHSRGRRVVRVEIEVGWFRQVVPETLADCWEVVVERTPLAGAELVVATTPAVIGCRTCGHRTDLAVPVMRCGACDSSDVSVVDGDQLRVVAIEVETEPVGVP